MEKARKVISTQESNLFPFIFRNKDNIAPQEMKNGSKIPQWEKGRTGKGRKVKENLCQFLPLILYTISFSLHKALKLFRIYHTIISEEEIKAHRFLTFPNHPANQQYNQDSSKVSLSAAKRHSFSPYCSDSQRKQELCKPTFSQRKLTLIKFICQ